ncbi:hypothetical protein BV20DRAFT_1118147, partial [Pilatotrama ljubarskyi]
MASLDHVCDGRDNAGDFRVSPRHSAKLKRATSPRSRSLFCDSDSGDDAPSAYETHHASQPASDEPDLATSIAHLRDDMARPTTPMQSCPAPTTPTLQQYVAGLEWPRIRVDAEQEQKKTSLLELDDLLELTAVQLVDCIPLMGCVATTATVDSILARTDTVAMVEDCWGSVQRIPLYQYEGCPVWHFGEVWKALCSGLPRPPPELYPPQVSQADMFRVWCTTGYRDIPHDVAMVVDTSTLTAQGWDGKRYVFCFARIKTDTALRAMTDQIMDICRIGKIGHKENLTFSPAERMLLQVWNHLRIMECAGAVLMGDNCVYVVERAAGTLYIDGPRYRFPEPGQKAFTTLDAIRLMAAMYLAKGRAECARLERAAYPPSTSTSAGQYSPVLRTWLSSAIPSLLRRMWVELRLVTCRRVQVQFPAGRVAEFSRNAAPLTGPVPASAWWGVVKLLAPFLPAVVHIKLQAYIRGGEDTTAWRGHVGETPVVLKMNRYVDPSGGERPVLDEWRRMSARLPQDVKKASALPIPAYHGFFVGDEADLILMSDCGRSLDDLEDTDETLREAHERVLAVLKGAGIEAEDVAPRNAVYDGQVVRVIDFV